MIGSRDTDDDRRTGPRGTTHNGADRRAADRKRIDEVFGETLPETTSDEARGRDTRLGDDWWREQRPPHHD
ncbi:hypothetical protein [Dietzia lutea]|uniref:Uncharacterized protein n=1 Tax=Dietzia lutea TaxID=546160 RepID=A0A2S1R8F9_9ACTN|nr:hypothetical protein [Dietzia lutea]AWH92586.1 hypothetical protein A6035_10900 [Dietzia lutea]